jgi:hypothetical protein
MLQKFARVIALVNLFMQTMQGPTLLKNVEPFAQKMSRGSFHIRPLHRISRRRISSSSDMSRIACRESPFNHVMNYSPELWQYWVRSRSRLCSGFSSTEWRDSNGFLRTTVITIHKLNIRWFSFPHLPSGTETLHLRGTPYIITSAASDKARRWLSRPIAEFNTLLDHQQSFI